MYAGFIMEYDNAIEESCSMIEEILPRYGFSSDDAVKTKKLVVNAFRGNFETLADNILHDSMYDYLGRVDYIRLTDKLLREETEYGRAGDLDEWIKKQKILLTNNEFITGTAALLRSVATEEQISSLNDFARGLK
jgi:hypothetical protein